MRRGLAKGCSSSPLLTMHSLATSCQSVFHLIKPHARAFALAAAFIFSAAQAHAQGCVVARGGGANAIVDGDGYLEKGHWEVSLAYRHFNSGRHFVGDDEQTQRQAL